jgi:hypothetical protein
MDRAALARRLRTDPAWTFCLLVGPGLTLFGILGLLLGNADFTVSDHPPHDPFPVYFEFNGWHHLLHVVSAAVLVAGVVRPRFAPAAAIVFGLIYLVVAPLGFADGDDVADLVYSGTADNVVHITLAVAGIAAGVLGARQRGRATEAQEASPA